jgi:hypothetical protein
MEKMAFQTMIDETLNNPEYPPLGEEEEEELFASLQGNWGEVLELASAGETMNYNKVVITGRSMQVFRNVKGTLRWMEGSESRYQLCARRLRAGVPGISGVSCQKDRISLLATGSTNALPRVLGDMRGSSIFFQGGGEVRLPVPKRYGSQGLPLHGPKRSCTFLSELQIVSSSYSEVHLMTSFLSSRTDSANHLSGTDEVIWQRSEDQARAARLRGKRLQQRIEWACDWTSTKMRTTLMEVTGSHVTNDAQLVYHFTSLAAAKLILASGSRGFRMSTIGQGGGGVYFTTVAPHEYGFGSNAFKYNAIIDCFGEERVEEYAQAPTFQVVLVCVVKKMMLLQVPGGRKNAMMIPRSVITSSRTAADDGYYYVEQTVIKRAFQLEDPKAGEWAPSAASADGVLDPYNV